MAAPEPPPLATPEPPPEVKPLVVSETPHQVFERSYINTGTGMNADTTDADWDDAIDSRSREQVPSLPPEEVPRIPPPVEAEEAGGPPPSFGGPKGSEETGTYYPGFGVVEEEEAATVRYSSSFDDDARTAMQYGVGDFDSGPPPTDEVPSAVLQDVSQSYSAPMHVPEPPPIPGILDRFTPVGAPGTGRQAPGRPSYLADPEPGIPAIEAPRMPRRPPQRDDEEVSKKGGLLPLLLGGAAVLLGGLALMAIILGFLYTSNTPEDPTSTTSRRATPVPSPAPVDRSVEGNGISIKVQEGLQTPPDTLAPEPEPERKPEPRVAPVAEPTRPRPSPRPAPAAPAVNKPVQTMGTLSIRSNRMALVYVDGRAIGLTPKSLKIEAGSRTISAMLPGQPKSKQTKTVKVKGGASVPVNFTF